MKTFSLFADASADQIKAAAYGWQFIIVWVLIFLLYRACKRRTTGWIMVGVCCGVCLLGATLATLTGEHAKEVEGVKTGLVLAAVAFIPFSIIMALRRKTRGWIVVGTLCALLVGVPVVLASLYAIGDRANHPTGHYPTPPNFDALVPTPSSTLDPVKWWMKDTLTEANKNSSDPVVLQSDLALTSKRVYAGMRYYGMPQTKAEGAEMAKRLNRKEEFVSIEYIQAIGGIPHVAASWWESSLINNPGIPQAEKTALRDAVNDCYYFADRINRLTPTPMP